MKAFNIIRFLIIRLLQSTAIILAGITITSLANAQPDDKLRLSSGGGESWNVDCVASINTAKQWISNREQLTPEELAKPELNLLQENLTVCAKLFNNPETSAYRACPDYQLFASLIANLKQNQTTAWWREKLEDKTYLADCQ